MRYILDGEQIQNQIARSGWDKIFAPDVLQQVKMVDFLGGEYIVHRDDRVAYLYFMCSGSAKILLEYSNGKESLLQFVCAPSLLGELELFTDGISGAQVIAIKKCRCLVVPAEVGGHQLKTNSTFLNYLCKYLCNKVIIAQKKASAMSCFPLKNRLAEFMLQMEEDGVYAVPHTEAAEYLGTSYRHLLLTFSHLADQGIICRRGGRYVITDRVQLTRLARQIQD